jgi:hypothetical protein
VPLEIRVLLEQQEVQGLVERPALRETLEPPDRLDPRVLLEVQVQPDLRELPEQLALRAQLELPVLQDLPERLEQPGLQEPLVRQGPREGLAR